MELLLILLALLLGVAAEALAGLQSCPIALFLGPLAVLEVLADLPLVLLVQLVLGAATLLPLFLVLILVGIVIVIVVATAAIVIVISPNASAALMPCSSEDCRLQPPKRSLLA